MRPIALRVLACSIAACPPAVAQTTLTVPAQHPSIQAAIAVAATGDTVLVSPGRYEERIDFLGKDILVMSTDGPAVTTIDSPGSGTAVVFVNGEGPGAVLAGFHVTHGDAGSGDGGGVRCVDTTPTLRDCWFRFNQAGQGGAIHLRRGGAVIDDCLFEDNAASGTGGAIRAIDAAVTLRRCAFRDNVASADGGGVALRRGTVAADDCAFVQNTAGDEGGAVQLDGTGGELFGAHLRHNVATRGAGVSIKGGATAALTGCVIGDNTASGRAGGVDIVDAAPTLTSCTVADNTAGAAAAGIGGSDASPRVTNTIVWGNRPGAIAFSGASAPVVTYSDVEGGFAGTGNLNANPRFASGPGGNYRLIASSPCVDAGTNTAPALPARDLDRQPRLGGTGIVDIGADELWTAGSVFLDRDAPTDCRLLCYNVWSNTIFPSVNPTQAAKFARIFAALDPDVVCLQEVSSSASSVRNLLDSLAPLGGGRRWAVYRGGNSSDVIAAKYPLSLQAARTSPAGQRDLGMALVDLPDSQFAHDLYVINSHYRCCGGEANDPQRQQQSDAIAAWMRDARTPGGAITLPVGTGIAVVGDWNIVGSFTPAATVLNGDIRDEGRYGPDAPPDWDGTPNVDVRPRHNGREPLDYTWRDDGSVFAPGRLDFLSYTDSVLRPGNAFVLNTGMMSDAERAATGLQIWDVTRDSIGEDYDHLPLVLDFHATTGPARSFGTGCRGLRNGFDGSASIGATLELRLYGAAPLEPLLLIGGGSATAWGLVPLPLSLAGLGASDCELLVALDALVPWTADAVGNARLSVPIPADPSLIGGSLFTQWGALPSSDPASWGFSDGLRIDVQP